MDGLRAFALVCLGGALGSGLRYAVTLGMLKLWHTRFPWGTLAVNLLGSALLAWLLVATEGGSLEDERLRLLLGVGLLGGFTTYSAFNLEVIALARAGDTSLALAYIVTTLLGALLAGLVVLRLAS